MPLQDKNIGFIGGGNMAKAIIGGLLRNSNTAKERIWAFAPSAATQHALTNDWGITLATSNQALIAHCDVILLCVKPQKIQAVLSALDFHVKPKAAMLISVAAGISAQQMQDWIGRETPILRAMPNTPALIGAGMSGVYANATCNQTHKNAAETILSAIGEYVWLDKESDLDLITALSGSGPAYFMQFTQHLMDAATQAGLNKSIARKAALATVLGSAKLMAQNDTDLKTLIENVTSPGGTTEQALHSFKQAHLKRIVQQAFTAASQRAETLSKEQLEK